MSGVAQLTVGDDEAEQRLDRWLKRRFPQVTQGMVERFCRKGELRVDGGRVKASTRVAPGQTIRVPPLPEALTNARDERRSAQAPAPDPALVADLKARIVFHDDDVLIIDKPAGLATQGGTAQRVHVDAALRGLRFGREEAPRLVHRLDRDTSGLLVLARSGAAATALTKAFRSRSVEKTYLAAVAGQPKPVAGTIRWGVVKAGGHGAEKMRPVHPDEIDVTDGAQHAVTEYRVVEMVGGRASAVLMRPLTGRTHQLRVHMAALGTPIVGDGKYGGRGQENLGDGWGASLGRGLSRKLHLHAVRLDFPHPRKAGHQVSVSAPLPDHMARTWEMLGWDVPAAFDPLD
ncbi:MAG: RluA family pseudouridine synthase [Pseudomonadota bacterium]